LGQEKPTFRDSDGRVVSRRRLDHLRRQLAQVAWVLRQQLAKTPLIRRLDRIDGFGLILSHVLTAEIGQMERFRNHKALASYCLLAPRSNDTGQEYPRESPKGRHLGQRGNRTLEWAFLEAARGAVRSGGRWRAMYDRTTASPHSCWDERLASERTTTVVTEL
jgi:transposase